MNKFIIISFLIIAGFVPATFFVHTSRHWLGLILAWTVVSTAVVTSIFGVGHHWDIYSLVTKFAATGMWVACIVIGSTVGILIVRRQSQIRAWQAVGGIVGGLIGMPLGLFVGIVAACSLTGDCL